MRLTSAIAWAALAGTALSATSTAHEGLNVLRTVARELRQARTESRTLKRGMPWDLGPCEPRCNEGDGLWDDCLISVNFTKCLTHCNKWNELADCFHCNQEVLRKDYRIYELQLGETCVKYLRDPTADPSWLGGDGGQNRELLTFGQAPTQTAQNNSSGPPPKTITVIKAS